MLGVLALVMVPFVLRLTYIPAPDLQPLPLIPHRRPKDSSTMGHAEESQDHQCPATARSGSGLCHLSESPRIQRSTQSTDDAYVQADFTLVAPPGVGVIGKVLVEENQPVKAGDLIAAIDDRDFIVAVDAAKAQVAAAEASVAGLAARVAQQETAIRQAQAAVAVDDAELKLAEANQKRYRNLASDGSGSIQAQQQAEAQLAIRLASRDKNRAGLQAARQQTDILKADLEKAKAALSQAQAAQAAAELKLSYTQSRRPSTA
ncbi:multidrug resistance protein MdtN [Salmonella enterica subsp. enterica]|uniref:Multidrug resistance protein MdtN n=1 Tax=Salmonella enterica I TaxID=59201 RepID=A0A379W305_SALET|nr:multidrug resistance protein MdtN [Salmonella enterica subsp. enterica]